MSQRGKDYFTNNKKKADWICHILRRICRPKHVIIGNLEGKMGVKGMRERSRKQLLDVVMERRGC